MSPRDKFLSLVDHRSTGANHGLFRVPTRDDKRMSGSWRELDDGRLLIFDHGGDSAYEIVAAIGLEITDLYPEQSIGHGKPERNPFPASDALRCLAFEGMVIAASGRQILTGIWSESEQSRLVDAVSRVSAAMTACGVRP